MKEKDYLLRVSPGRTVKQAVIRSDVSAMSDSDIGDQQMLITVSTNFQNFVDVPSISTCGRYPVYEHFPLSSSSLFTFSHPGQCNGFQLILSHNMTHKSDLPANNHLQEIP